MTNQHGGVDMDGNQEDAQIFAMSWTAVNRELTRLDQDVRELRLDVKRLDEKIDARIEEVRNEIRELRLDVKRLDEKIDTRIEEVRNEIRDLRNELKNEMDKRFEQVDKRFEQVDKRFEQVDKRLDKVESLSERIMSRLNLYGVILSVLLAGIGLLIALHL